MGYWWRPGAMGASPGFPMTRRAAGIVLAFLIAAALLAALFIDQKAAAGGGFFGDESVYLAAAQSLAYDFDLRYTRGDLERISRDWEAGPSGLVLQRVGDSLYYAKPYLYPLIAALPCRSLGANGLLMLNMLLFGAVLVSAYRYLLRYNAPGLALAFALGFFGLSTAYPYAWWMHPEVLQLTLVFFALRFFLAAREPASANSAKLEVLSGIFMALAIYAKPTNLALLLVPAFDLVRGPRRAAMRLGAAAALGLVVVVLVGHSFTGSWWTYGGERKRFEAVVPFQSERYTFDSLGTSVTTQEAHQRTWGWQVLPRNTVYFLVGRFTGMLPYAPLALSAACLFLIRRPREPRRLVLLAALVLYSLGLLVFLPENYHGGGGAIGNRWFLNLLPGFFFLVQEIRPLWPAVAGGALGIFFLAPLLTNPLFAAQRPGHHATRAPFTLLPLEITLTVNWPTNTDPSRYRLRFPDHLVYLADYNCWAEPDGRLALRGAARAEMALRGPRLGSLLLVEVENGPGANDLELEVDGKSARFELGPGARATQLLTNLHPLELGSSRLLHLQARCSSGAIPRYRGGPGGGEHRYLGAYLRLSVAPEQVVDRLYQARRWRELARALDFPPAKPDALFLAQGAAALRRCGRSESARDYAARAAAELPVLLNALRTAIPASLAPASAIVIRQDPQERWVVAASGLDATVPLAPDRQSAGLLLLRALPRGRYRLELELEGLPAGAPIELRGRRGQGISASRVVTGQPAGDSRIQFELLSQGESGWELGLPPSAWSENLSVRALDLVLLLPELVEPRPRKVQ